MGDDSRALPNSALSSFFPAVWRYMRHNGYRGGAWTPMTFVVGIKIRYVYQFRHSAMLKSAGFIPHSSFGHFTWSASVRGVWNLSLQARYTATIRITLLAENRGFEPLEVLPSTVFKTVAFNHSANFPDSVWVCTSLTNKRQSDR